MSSKDKTGSQDGKATQGTDDAPEKDTPGTGAGQTNKDAEARIDAAGPDDDVSGDEIVGADSDESAIILGDETAPPEADGPNPDETSQDATAPDAEDTVTDTAAQDDSAPPEDPAPQDTDVTQDASPEPEAVQPDEEKAVAATIGAATAGAAASTAAEPEPVKTKKSAKRKGGFMANILGGLIAAAIGFGAATYTGLFSPDNTRMTGAISGQASRLASLEMQLEEMTANAGSTASDAIATQFDALGAQLGEQFAARVDGLTGTLASMQDGLSALELQLGDLEGRLSDAESRPITGGDSAAQQALAAYEADLDALRTELTQQTESNKALAADLEKRAAAAQTEMESAAERAAELQREAEKQTQLIQEKAEARATSAALREALVSLDASLKTGVSYERSLGALGESAEIPPVLVENARTGISSLTELRDSFPPLAREALDASIRETVGDDVASRAIAFFRAETRVRSLTPREGNDPDAVLSRAEAALRDSNYRTALEELSALPQSGQQVMSEWMTRLRTRLEVTEAADELTKTLLAN